MCIFNGACRAWLELFYSASVYTEKCGIPTNSSAATWLTKAGSITSHCHNTKYHSLKEIYLKRPHNFLQSSSLAAPIPSDHRVFPLSV